MAAEGTPTKGAEAPAKQRKQAIRKKARDLAAQQSKEWANVSKEERKEFRKAARTAAPSDLSALLGNVSGGKEPREASERTGSAPDPELPPTGRNSKRKKPTT